MTDEETYEDGNGVDDLEQVDIHKLNHAAYNPRSISSVELQKLARSIEEFGFVEPVVVNVRSEEKGWPEGERDMTIVGGHQRTRAALILGRKTVPCVFVDLDERMEKLLNLALNRIQGDWDGALLADLLAELEADPSVDPSLSGFDRHEIDRLVAASQIAPPSSFPDVAADAEDVRTQHVCPSCGYQF